MTLDLGIAQSLLLDSEITLLALDFGLYLLVRTFR